MSRHFALLVLLFIIIGAPAAAAAREVQLINGNLRCAAGLPADVELAERDCAADVAPLAEFDMAPRNVSRVTLAFFELRWMPIREGLSDQLAMSFPAPSAASSVGTNGNQSRPSRVSGASTLVARVESSRPDADLYPRGRTLHFEVRAHRGLVVNQPFQFAATWVENESLPAQYSGFVLEPKKYFPGTAEPDQTVGDSEATPTGWGVASMAGAVLLAGVGFLALRLRRRG